jgi:HSP20 family molecular chaperone IbpA
MTDIMWVQALATLARPDRVQRDAVSATSVGWEPSMDVLETENGVLVVVALPGVRREDIEIVIAGGAFSVRGTRRWLRTRSPVLVHRVEVPHGQFERRLPLPPGSYRLEDQDHVDGCLLLTLRRLD